MAAFCLLVSEMNNSFVVFSGCRILHTHYKHLTYMNKQKNHLSVKELFTFFSPLITSVKILVGVFLCLLLPMCDLYVLCVHTETQFYTGSYYAWADALFLI